MKYLFGIAILFLGILALFGIVATIIEEWRNHPREH